MTPPLPPLTAAETAPKRIQRRRTKGWRLPEGAVVVSRPGPWGNPWALGDVGIGTQPDGLPWLTDDVVRWFRQYAREELVRNPDWLAPLRGRDLVCWCPEPCGVDVDLGWGEFGGPYDPCTLPRGHEGYHDPSVPPWCHADVLLELANR